jgi:hypothetical protein
VPNISINNNWNAHDLVSPTEKETQYYPITKSVKLYPPIFWELRHSTKEARKITSSVRSWAGRALARLNDRK